MEIKDFWNWVEKHNDDCLVQYNESSSSLTLAIDSRTLDDFMETFAPDFGRSISVEIYSTAIGVDVTELLDDQFSAEVIWEQRIPNLNEDW